MESTGTGHAILGTSSAFAKGFPTPCSHSRTKHHLQLGSVTKKHSKGVKNPPGAPGAWRGERSTPGTPTPCRQSWHSIISTLQLLMRLLSLFRCFLISQTFLEGENGDKTPITVIVDFFCVS